MRVSGSAAAARQGHFEAPKRKPDRERVREHLDYLEWLGVDMVWFNPCFASPFRDAGYDVSDYLAIAPRYGTNGDMTALIQEAGKRGIRVLLDLVAGHTSVDHPWFRASMNEESDHRYVWSDRPGDAFVPSRRDGDRAGTSRTFSPNSRR